MGVRGGIRKVSQSLLELEELRFEEQRLRCILEDVGNGLLFMASITVRELGKAAAAWAWNVTWISL